MKIAKELTYTQLYMTRLFNVFRTRNA